MKLPNKVFEPDLDIKSGTVSFYKRKNYSEDVNPERLKLPEWLVAEIKYELEASRRTGRKEIQVSVRSVLGI